MTVPGRRVEEVLVDAEPATRIHVGETMPLMFEWNAATQTYIGGRVAVRRAMTLIENGLDVHRVHSCP